MKANKKILLIIIILVLLVGGFCFLQKYLGISLWPWEKETAETFGEKIYQMVKNPAEEIPQTNPFRAEINPFDDLKINPFE